MAGTLRTVALSELHRNIDEAVKNISQCADSVHQKVFDLGPLSIDFHSQLREEYEKNITDTIEKVRKKHGTILYRFYSMENLMLIVITLFS